MLRRSLGTNPTSYPVVRRTISSGYSGSSKKLTTHLHSVPKCMHLLTKLFNSKFYLYMFTFSCTSDRISRSPKRRLRNILHGIRKAYKFRNLFCVIFRRVRNFAKNDYYLRHVSLYVSPFAWNNSAPSRRIFIKI